MNWIAKTDLGIDLFGILLVNCYSDGYDKHADNAVITSVNLFRYVFAELSSKVADLNGNVWDESYAPVPKSPLFVAAVDGRLLEKCMVFCNQTAAGIKTSVSRVK